MAGISVHEPFELDDPTLIEGFPGVGLVGKIATDHLIESFDMEYSATVRCDGLPQIGIYHDGDRHVKPPVRLYVAPDHDLLALQSDVPVPKSAAGSMTDCVTGWLEREEITPVYLSGYPEEDRSAPPSVFGVGSGAGADRLDALGLDTPSEDGAVGGPTGALLSEAAARGMDAIGLIVETNPQFPDPEAARSIIEHGIQPLLGFAVPVDALVDHAEQIRSQREALAKQLKTADEGESTQAQPLRMFQ